MGRMHDRSTGGRWGGPVREGSVSAFWASVVAGVRGGRTTSSFGSGGAFRAALGADTGPGPLFTTGPGGVVLRIGIGAKAECGVGDDFHGGVLHRTQPVIRRPDVVGVPECGPGYRAPCAARTSQELVEVPSCAAACSTWAFRLSGRRREMRAVPSSSGGAGGGGGGGGTGDRKSTRLNSSHVARSYDVFCLKTKKQARKK